MNSSSLARTAASNRNQICSNPDSESSCTLLQDVNLEADYEFDFSGVKAENYSITGINAIIRSNFTIGFSPPSKILVSLDLTSSEISARNLVLDLGINEGSKIKLLGSILSSDHRKITDTEGTQISYFASGLNLFDVYGRATIDETFISGDYSEIQTQDFYGMGSLYTGKPGPQILTSGGGRVYVRASSLTIDESSRISSNAYFAECSKSIDKNSMFGTGGTVFIVATSLVEHGAGKDTFQARGGGCSNNHVVINQNQGSGGRIYLHVPINDVSVLMRMTSTINQQPEFYSGELGGPGTVYLTTLSQKILLVSGYDTNQVESTIQSTYLIEISQYLDEVVVSGYMKLMIHNSITEKSSDTSITSLFLNEGAALIYLTTNQIRPVSISLNKVYIQGGNLYIQTCTDCEFKFTDLILGRSSKICLVYFVSDSMVFRSPQNYFALSTTTTEFSVRSFSIKLFGEYLLAITGDRLIFDSMIVQNVGLSRHRRIGLVIKSSNIVFCNSTFVFEVLLILKEGSSEENIVFYNSSFTRGKNKKDQACINGFNTQISEYVRIFREYCIDPKTQEITLCIGSFSNLLFRSENMKTAFVVLAKDNLVHFKNITVESSGFVEIISKQFTLDSASVINTSGMGCSSIVPGITSVEFQHMRLCGPYGGSSIGWGSFGMKSPISSCLMFTMKKQDKSMYSIPLSVSNNS